MGTLSDITSRASNNKRRSDGSLHGSAKGYKPLASPFQKENTKTRSPHFMTPTFASKQTSTPTANSPTTPVKTPASITALNAKPFLRRVGLRRVAETSRSKRESPKQKIAFPDKLAATVYAQPPPTPPSVKKPVKVSPQDKPLPKTPIAQLHTSSPPKPARTLIDATEKPLWLSPQGAEEWPVLRPRPVASTASPQDVMRETGPELEGQAPIVEGERYPKLGDLTRSCEQSLPRSIYSLPQKSERKEVSAPSLKKAGEMTDPFQDPTIETVTRRGVEASNLAAEAAALEKSTSQDVTEVRQTRTSSLRARLSVGEVVKDRSSKVIGFTDFTAKPGSGFPHGDSLPMRKEPRTASTSTDNTIRPQASIESLNRAPAKFVAGSRRVRPPRRGSLREEARPSTASSRPGTCDSASVYSNDRPASKGGKDSCRSSIPLPKAATTSLPSSAGTSATYVENGVHDISPTTDSSVFHAKPMQAVRVTISTLGDEKATITDVKNKSRSLDAIEESPRHAYTFRRLSTKSPEFGPTLAISPSAKKYIMGIDDKENKAPGHDGRSASNGTIQANGGISSATRSRLERPQSISSPRRSLVEPQTREKRARSADIGAMTDGLKVAKPLSKNPSDASSVNSPFYDASEELGKDTTPRASRSRRSIAQDEGWISPLKKSIRRGMEDSTPVNTTAHAPNHMNGTLMDDEYDPFKYDKQLSENAKRAKDASTIAAAPNNTPIHAIKAPERLQPEGISPTAFPLRSTSHQHKPASTETRKTSSVNGVTKETGPPTPPKEFVHRQNNLGSARGHASSQLDLAKPNGSNTEKRASAFGSVKSHSSLVTSTSRSRFNLKTLFHKRSTETLRPKSRRGSKKASVQRNGSPFPPINEVHPIHRPIARSSPRTSANLTPTLQKPQQDGTDPAPVGSIVRPLTPLPPPVAATTPSTTPTAAAPVHANLSHTTNVTMDLLDAARREAHSPKKEKLLELGKIMVDVITQARDAERAVEEARLALAKAETAQLGCERAVREVGRIVQARGLPF